MRVQERGLTLRNLMSGTGSWWIQRTGADYKFIRSLGSGEFLSYDWHVIASGIPGPYLNLHQLGFARVGVPMLSVDDREGTYDATGWTVAMGTTATQGYKAITVDGSIASGTLTRFTATAGAGTFSPNDKGRRIQIPGASSVGGDLTVLISTVAADGSYVTWGTPNGVVGSYTATLHASYRWTTTVGNSATWVSPAGSTALGVRRLANTSGGLFKVTVNGSATAANLLPTAQEKVTAGEYPASILTTGGGTLAPTDRVLDCYSPSTIWDDPLAIADGLAPGAHAVVLTCTGYTHAGAINNRAQLTGFSYSVGTETPATPGAEVLATAQWQVAMSAHEFAYRFVPDFLSDGVSPNPNAGSIPPDFFGRVHGYENETGLTFVVDGATVTPADGSVTAVSQSAIITQTSTLHHPDNNPATCASVVTTYTLDAEGMTVEHTEDWLTSARLNGGYPVMLPVSSAFDRYTNSGFWRRATSTSGNGTRAAEAPAWIAVSWMSAGKYAASVELTQGLARVGAGRDNPGMAAWWLEDRAPISGIKINKQYQPWAAQPATPAMIASGDSWRFSSRYRFKRFPDGAEPAFTQQ